MKALFLDFDGVINTLVGKDVHGNEKGTFKLPKDMRVNNEYNVALLSKLCLEYDLKIVVTSTWRFTNKKYPVKDVLYNSGLDKNVKIFDVTCHFFGMRGIEIYKFLHKNPSVENFIIIDDINIPGYEDHLIKCNLYDGFNEEKYEEAKEYIENGFSKTKKRK